ncbi:MAG: InlB B-repeat-containing protein [Clostridiales bacterium]|nr:InlB B-repeat-containing protein [Clostridiales bacterium]
MKKSRLLIAVIAALTFVLAAFGLIACDKDAGELGAGGGGGGGQTNNGTQYTITFVYGEGTGTPATAKTGTDGKLSTLPTPTAPANKKFDAWYTQATGGAKVTTNTTFKTNTSIYARYTDNGTTPPNPTGEYTITFNYNGGSGTPATATTTNGKLTTLPTNVTAPSGKTFDAWYDAATGGNKVTTNTTFSANTTIYAQYTPQQQQGGDDHGDTVAIDTTAEDKGYLVYSTSTDRGVEMTLDPGDYGAQFVLESYHLEKDTVIKFQNGTGSIERTTVSGGTASAYFTPAVGGLKVVKSGTYTFYVKVDNDEIYVNGTPDFEAIEGDTMTVTVNCADGTITFTIEKDAGKTPHLHAWQGNTNLFGDWPGKELSDGETVDLSSYNMSAIGLIVNYGTGNAQTDDITLSGGNVTILVSKDGGFKIQ